MKTDVMLQLRDVEYAYSVRDAFLLIRTIPEGFWLYVRPREWENDKTRSHNSVIDGNIMSSD